MNEQNTQSSSYAYGDFRLGVVVPPANPTVEPEFAMLLPAGIVPYITRLPGALRDGSTSTGLRQRIDGYISELYRIAGSFGGMGLNATCVAHTGISYVVGLSGEKSIRDDLASSGSEHAYLTTDAIHAVLQKLGVTRLGLVSPYPLWLEDLAVEYWRSRNFNVVEIVSLGAEPSIYEVSQTKVRSAVMKVLDSAKPEAVLLSGTGLPTLSVLEEVSGGDIPVVSSNACSAWYASQLHSSEAAHLGSSVISAIDTWENADV